MRPAATARDGQPPGKAVEGSPRNDQGSTPATIPGAANANAVVAIAALRSFTLLLHLNAARS
ncbi:MAG TPA: hypothetical protein VK063_08460, partial [Beutenbergiaceae bacterium]|nr:hypothetical protein [Beutenbergiaceae bacterium]